MERLTDYFGVLNSFQNDFSHKNKKELRRKKTCSDLVLISVINCLMTLLLEVSIFGHLHNKNQSGVYRKNKHEKNMKYFS